MKVALIHDWLNGMRGGEKVLEVLCELLPDADIFTLFHEPANVSTTINAHKITTSFIQAMPWATKKYRWYLPLFPKAIERFDLAEYEVVISISHCVAKGVIPSQNATHICYCLTPMRYIWDLYDQYFPKNRVFSFKRWAMALVVEYLRTWDINSSSKVDKFIAISHNINRKIQRYYHREAEVIYPPVDSNFFAPDDSAPYENEDYYLIASAFVPYKRLDIAISAFNETGKRLIIVGRGPEEESVRKGAKSNIEFTGWVSDERLLGLYRKCKALVFPGEEDFGIVPLEAQSCGKPVIAFGKGGALETVVDGETGVFFQEQTAQCLNRAIERLESVELVPERIRDQAKKFDRKFFKESLKNYLSENTNLEL